MLWSLLDARNFHSIGRAESAEFKTAVGRFCMDRGLYDPARYKAGAGSVA
jgi:hypothetical protein